jgi:glucan biosynthesis protein
MPLCHLRTSPKYRILSAIDRYGMHATGITDIFRVKGRAPIAETLPEFGSVFVESPTPHRSS